MKKTIEMWCVFDPKGVPIEWTLNDWDEYDSVKSGASRFLGLWAPSEWDYWEKQGYTCRKVQVTIEEI